MKPIRVLQVVTVMNRGGLETMLMNYYRRLNRDKVQFDFLVHRSERGHYDDEIERLGGTLIRMPPIRPGHYRGYFDALDRLFRERPDYRVVHSHINENSSFVLRAARKAGVPCRIVHSHISDLGIDWKLPFRLYARREMKDHPNRYFACSVNAGKWLYGAKLAGSGRLVVLKNAVDAELFRFNPERRAVVRGRLGVENKLVFGHVGRFNKQKNHEFLIDIFKKVHERNADAVLLLVGEGVLKREIEEKAKFLGLSDAVRFLGVRADIPDIMQAMDLFLFPSLFEGLPVSMIEAQAAGLRCIVSDTITRETDVTGLVEFVSLKRTAADWADFALSAPTARTDTLDRLRDSGYDTQTTARWLEQYYMSSAAAETV